MHLSAAAPRGGEGPGQVDLALPQLGTQQVAVPTDIDECSSSPCVNGVCRNLAGSYACECAPGSRLGPSGTMCVGERRWQAWASVGWDAGTSQQVIPPLLSR
jgi:hypothetical protein